MVTLGFAPSPGDSFLIIANDGTDPVQGHFLFLPERAALNVGGQSLRISYVGGDGNDVVLTAAPALTTVRLWDGGGTDNFWTTPANWVDDIAPQPGDYVGFPAPAARKLNTNDFPAGTAFPSLTFGGGGYALHGQGLRLGAGIEAINTFGQNRIALPLQIQADQTFASSIGELVIDGTVDLGANALSLAGAGSVTINGVVAGSGSIVKRGSGVAGLFGTNTYSGPTAVLEGQVTINNASSLGTLDQPTTVAPDAILFAPGAGSFREPVILAGSLSVNGTWTGPIETISSNASMSGIIEGTISGTGGVVAQGSLRLVANNTYTGTTIHGGGTMTVLGDQPQSDCLNLTGLLQGSGRVGNVTALGGTVTPGTHTNPISRFSTGNFDLRKPAGLVLEFWGTNAGVTYDQMRVTGSVNLEEPTLGFFSFFYVLQAGQSFTIINNDGTDPVQGMFAGWPQGGFKVLTNGIFQIDYAGGDGNDVVVSRVYAPPATILSLGTNYLGGKWLTVRGFPGATYALEGTPDLNPGAQWLQLDTGYAQPPNGLFSLYDDSPPPTNSMKFYRVRSF